MVIRNTLLVVFAAVTAASAALAPSVPFARGAPPAFFEFPTPSSAPSADFDLLVIGAGPAGVEAAATATPYGLRVGLVERKACITGMPTGVHSKEMRQAYYQGAQTFREISKVIVDSEIRAHASTEERLHELGVVTLSGDATVKDARTVSLATADGQRLVTAASIMIATGAHATRPSSLPFQLPGMFESDTISTIDYLPRRVVIQGGGPVGLEYALVFAKLGAEVTIVQQDAHVMPDHDSSLRVATLTSLKNAGVEVLVSTAVDSVTKATGDGGHSVAWHPLLNVQVGNHTLESDCFLYSIGTRGSVDGLGLETLQAFGLRLTQDNMIETDERQRTGVDGIYAIGDVAGAGLATIAEAQAITAVRDLVSSRSWRPRPRASQTALAAGLWTIPSVSYAGLSEEEAATQYPSVGTVRVEYNSTARGWISGESGFLKLVYSKTSGAVLGVHIFGETSMELVGFGAEAINSGRTIFDLLDYVLPAVTLSQIYHKAAEEAWLTSFKDQEASV